VRSLTCHRRQCDLLQESSAGRAILYPPTLSVPPEQALVAAVPPEQATCAQVPAVQFLLAVTPSVQSRVSV
jgi:hypothetical protein